MEDETTPEPCTGYVQPDIDMLPRLLNQKTDAAGCRFCASTWNSRSISTNPCSTVNARISSHKGMGIFSRATMSRSESNRQGSPEFSSEGPETHVTIIQNVYMYICEYICIYVKYVYIYICVHLYIYIYGCVYIHIYIYKEP